MRDRSPRTAAGFTSPPVAPTRRLRYDHTPEVLFLGAQDAEPALPSASICVVCVLEAHPGPPGLRSGKPAEAGPTSSAGSIAPIVEVSYGGTPIAAGTLHEDGLCTLLPFAGGPLDPGKLAASAYVAVGAAAPAVSTLVIVREPNLSDLERRALDRLPGEMSRLALDPGPDAGATVARLLEMRAELILAGRLS